VPGESDFVGPLPAPTGPVKALEVGSYQDLRSRAVVGDGLEHDHIPSFAVLRTAAEADNGGPLTAEELGGLYNNATAVEVPRDVHIDGPTFGGNNTPAQIAGDAADLPGAILRDTNVLRNNLIRRGYDPAEVE
jgi:filamentous hemagglutinin